MKNQEIRLVFSFIILMTLSLLSHGFCPNLRSRASELGIHSPNKDQLHRVSTQGLDTEVLKNAKRGPKERLEKVHEVLSKKFGTGNYPSSWAESVLRAHEKYPLPVGVGVTKADKIKRAKILNKKMREMTRSGMDQKVARTMIKKGLAGTDTPSIKQLLVDWKDELKDVIEMTEVKEVIETLKKFDNGNERFSDFLIKLDDDGINEALKNFSPDVLAPELANNQRNFLVKKYQTEFLPPKGNELKSIRMIASTVTDQSKSSGERLKFVEFLKNASQSSNRHAKQMKEALNDITTFPAKSDVSYLSGSQMIIMKLPPAPGIPRRKLQISFPKELFDIDKLEEPIKISFTTKNKLTLSIMPDDSWIKKLREVIRNTEAGSPEQATGVSNLLAVLQNENLAKRAGHTIVKQQALNSQLENVVTQTESIIESVAPFLRKESPKDIQQYSIPDGAKKILGN